MFSLKGVIGMRIEEIMTEEELREYDEWLRDVNEKYAEYLSAERGDDTPPQTEAESHRRSCLPTGREERCAHSIARSLPQSLMVCIMPK